MIQHNKNLGAKARQALYLAARGMHVFPLQPGKRIPVGGCKRCRTSSPERVPHTAEDCACIPDGMHCHGSHAATTDPEVIQRWWSMPKNTEAGIGVHLGKSGLIMLDIDSHKDGSVDADQAMPGVHPTITRGLTAYSGWDSIAMLAAERGQAEPWNEAGVKVLTPSCGLHVWYRVSDPARYKNIDGKLAWQVDIKAGPAFAVAPGTWVEDKGVYASPVGSSWGDGPAPLPAWLDAEIRRVGGWVELSRNSLRERLRGAQRPSQPPSAEFIETVMGEALTAIQGAPSGQRNAALNAAAFKVGRALVARDGTLRDVLSERLMDAAVQGGTPHLEARATVASGMTGGIKAAR
jgi:hypothetical protein